LYLRTAASYKYLKKRKKQEN